MFCRTAVTLTYGDFVRRSFASAMKVVGPIPTGKGKKTGKYLGKVHKEIARRYAKMSPAAKVQATRKK